MLYYVVIYSLQMCNKLEKGRKGYEDYQMYRRGIRDTNK